MKKRILFVIGIMIFILGQIGVNYLIFKEKNNTTIPKVKLKEKKKDTFAIMLEQDDGTYQATESTSFNQPGYEFNTEKSGCIDINGNKIENALSYDETIKVVGVTSNKTIYCYVYFDLKPNDGATQLIESGKLWTSGLEGDGYRYTGINPDNYICFGTTNKDTCTSNTDAYMYRIIGVFPDSTGRQHMKLIKKEALNTKMAWNDSDTNVNWGLSTLFNALNGNTYLTNTTYMPVDGTKNWSDRITNWTWSAVNTNTFESSGPNYRTDVTTRQMYLHELNRNGKSSTIGEWTTPSGKIGLMYASDYQMSLGSSALSYISSSNYSTLKTGWMFLSNNDQGAPNEYEWTISRYGNSSEGYGAWCVFSFGYVSINNLYVKYSTRPVFYLDANQIIQSGFGKINDPFILS